MNMRFQKRLALAFAAAALLGFGSTTHAQTWSGSFTDIDLGVVYTLSDLTAESFATQSYSLVINTAGYTGPSGAFLDSVDIKAWGDNAAPSNVLEFTFSAPSTGSLLPVVNSSWSATEGPINNGGTTGCGSGTAGFACIEAATKGVFNVGPTYTFGFTVTAANATDFFTSNIGSHVGAGYANFSGDGEGYGITSVTMIPEPEIYAMMLAGLALMGFVARRRNQQTQEELAAA